MHTTATQLRDVVERGNAISERLRLPGARTRKQEGLSPKLDLVELTCRIAEGVAADRDKGTGDVGTWREGGRAAGACAGDGRGGVGSGVHEIVIHVVDVLISELCAQSLFLTWDFIQYTCNFN